MKRVLIIDENSTFCEYLKAKLSKSGIEVETAANKLNGLTKIGTTYPDLIIIDYHMRHNGCVEILQVKKANPNTVNVPIIVTARDIDQHKVVTLTPHKVKKIFTKPVKIDALFAAISEALGIDFNLDESPCLLEVHVNENIFFVEVAHGLNRDKMELLEFKIIELMEIYSVKAPKIIVMISDMSLSFPDAPNIQMFMDVILKASGTHPENIRVLTKDHFVKKFIWGKYASIKVDSNLQYIMDDLLGVAGAPAGVSEAKTEFIEERVLVANPGVSNESLQLRFDADSKPKTFDDDTIKEYLHNVYIAAVDDDPVTLELIKAAFKPVGGNIVGFTSGADFLEVVHKENFDLLFLDLMMPGMNGFTVLDRMSGNNLKIPVIILSSLSDRAAIIKAFRLGSKSYITKPFQPKMVIKKAVEILHSSL